MSPDLIPDQASFLSPGLQDTAFQDSFLTPQHSFLSSQSPSFHPSQDLSGARTFRGIEVTQYQHLSHEETSITAGCRYLQLSA